MKNVKLPIIIFAGSPPERDNLMEYADVDYKALIDIHGKPMLTRILDAVVKSDMASYILIAGVPEEKVTLPEGIDESIVDYYLVTGETVDKVVKTGNFVLEKAKESPGIFEPGTTNGMYIMGDVPVINSDSIKNFINSCTDRSGEFYYPIINKNDMDQSFPENGRSFNKIEGQYYCGGDIVMIDLTKLEKSYSKIQLVADNRKSLIKGMFFASPIIFLKYILKRIKLKEIEKLMTKVFEVDSRLIISSNPEIAFDVDKPYQLDLARKHFASENIST